LKVVEEKVSQLAELWNQKWRLFSIWISYSFTNNFGI